MEKNGRYKEMTKLKLKLKFNEKKELERLKKIIDEANPFCMIEDCYNRAIVKCYCGKCFAYCKEHISEYKDDNFLCEALKPNMLSLKGGMNK